MDRRHEEEKREEVTCSHILHDHGIGSEQSAQKPAGMQLTADERTDWTLVRIVWMFGTFGTIRSHQGLSMKTLLALLLVFLPAAAQYQPPVFTQTDRSERVRAATHVVDSLYRSFAERRRLPGLVWGVVVDGELIHSGQIGDANLARKIPADSRALFRIASMSKSVTAMAVMKLWEEGKVQLDAPAETYLPEMKGLKLLTTDARLITVRDLMTHGAGFPEDNPWGDRRLADSDQDLIDFMRDGVSFSNAPGVEFEYANLGFALLGRIVTEVSGMPYQRYTTEHIFKPLGMSSTTWEWKGIPEGRLALGYQWRDGVLTEEPMMHDGSWGAMGGLITSIEDFSKYVAFHMSAWPPRDGEDSGPVRRSSVREMQHPWRFATLAVNDRFSSGRPCPLVRAYGFGLDWTRDCRGRTFVGHSGGLPGFGSNWMIMPEHGLGVLAFDNLTYSGTSGLNAQVLDTLLAMTKLERRSLPPSKILERRKDELMKVLPDWKDAEGSGLFADNFFLDTSVVSWRRQSQALFAKIGAVKSVGPVEPENQLRGTFVVEGEQGKLSIFFTLTSQKDPLIQQLRIREVRSQ
jgi:CubicO group peptidase (beta-lactamase class C family)